jgi:hypothetical protein
MTTERRIGPVLRFIQHVAVHFSPGGIVDFHNDGFEVVSLWIEAVVEGCRIEAITEISEVTKESYRAGKAFACS